MPRIMRTGGLNLSDDVVKIRDMGPVPKVRPKTKPRPRPEPEDPDGAMELGEDFGGLEEEELTGEDFEPDYEPEDYGEAAPVGAAAVTEEIIRGAMAEAGRILEEAVRKAEEQKAEKLAEVQYEADRMRRAAAVEGRREGMAEALDTVRQSAATIENAIASFEGERAGFEAEYEQQLKWLAIEIASKVLAKKVAQDDAEMTEMVEKAVQSVKNESWIRIEVAQEMTGLIDRLTALFDGSGNVSVSPVPAEAGTVHIETPSGVVDASLRTQLANLRDYFAQASG